MAVAVRRQDGTLTDPEKLEQTWRDRITQAREARRQFEPIWMSNLAFAAGRMWLVWDQQQRRMRHLAEVDPRYVDRELYTADRINEQRQAQLGELSGDDDRPELLLAQQGDTAEALQKEINAAVAYGWDHEWHADEALEQIRSLCLDLGTNAIRCRFDPTLGPVVGEMPIYQGQPVTDPAQAHELLANGPREDVQIRTVHEGRTVWEPLSAFNLLTPPGVNHEDKFPWEIVVRPVLLDTVIEEYGEAVAGDLKEDNDIASVIGLSTSQQTAGSAAAAESSTKGRLRGHVWLFTCYERPSRTSPNGQVVVMASNRMKLLDVAPELPYQAPDGTRRSGVTYFHWWRMNDRFYSRSFIEPMKDPQRLINRRETQNAEIIDRGMPKVFTQEGDLVHDPTGLPLENIELKTSAQEPKFFQGMGPGAWMYEDIAHHVDNLGHASTLSAVALGENPSNVQTYAQLALLNENEAGKRSTILTSHKRSIARLIEDSVWDIRRYWPAEKTILVAGDEGQISQQVFQKSKVPDFYVVKVAKGAPLPRSQAAELSKLDAIWSAATGTGVADAPGQNEKWVRWYAASLDAGIAQELPELESDSQAEVAAFENFLMVEQQTVPAPAEYDLAPVHIPIHREAQDHARAAGDEQTYERIQQHIEQSVEMAAVTRKAWRIPDPSDVQDIASDVALDEAQALRENQMLLAGMPVNPEALQQAVAAIQQGHDPDTGQELQQGFDVHAALIRASLKPTLVENLQVHLDRHGKVIKSKQFQTFPPDARGRFIDHFNQTRDLWLSIPTMPQEVVAPKVSLSLRESVGPTTVADVLRRAGVPEADAQTVASEPSMENLISRTDPPIAADQAGEHYPARGPL
jgi:hypothetical protein